MSIEILSCERSGRGWNYQIRHADGSVVAVQASRMGPATLQARINFHVRRPGMPVPSNMAGVGGDRQDPVGIESSKGGLEKGGNEEVVEGEG